MAEFIFIDFNKVVGERIKFYREKIKMTQEELSNLTGITRQRIIEIEQGATDVSILEICRIAYALGIYNEDLIKNESLVSLKVIGEKKVRYVSNFKKRTKKD